MPTPQSPTAHAIAEMEQEAVATRRLFDRLPADKLGWRPHPKSYTLGQLALHIAQSPAALLGMMATNEFDVSKADLKAAQPKNVAEVKKAFEDSLATARTTLGQWTQKDLESPWRVVNGPKPLMAMPKHAAVRSLVLSHIYHHRGQLTVYLRMLDVPLPAVYGPSADEQIFG